MDCSSGFDSSSSDTDQNPGRRANHSVSKPRPKKPPRLTAPGGFSWNGGSTAQPATRLPQVTSTKYFRGAAQVPAEIRHLRHAEYGYRAVSVLDVNGGLA